MADHYQTLGVPKTATQDEIRNAYRKLAKKYHPDLNSGKKESEEKFKQVQEAYDILGDEAKRAAYDNPPRNPFGNQFGGGSPFEDPFIFDIRSADMGRMNDIFSQIFGQRTNFHAQNQNVNLRYEITLEDAFKGKDAELDFTIPGTGELRHVKFSIPAGVDVGNKIRCKGQGAAAIKDAPPGDLFIVISIVQHPKFKRHGPHLHYDLLLDVLAALTGDEVILPTIDHGQINLKIPAATQHEQIFRIPGKGMPLLHNGSAYGDMYVHIKLTVPLLDDAKRATIGRLRKKP